MKYEKFSDGLAPRTVWLGRVGRSFSLAVALLGTSLFIGISGYHWLGQLPWVDAILEASMILGGMGPIAIMKSDAVKLFASVYALFSGFILLSSFGIFTAPWLHRLLHYFHSDEPEK